MVWLPLAMGKCCILNELGLRRRQWIHEAVMSEKTGQGEQSGKTWGGRFAEATNALVVKYTESISFDSRLAKHDILGSQAQARMLGNVGLVSPDEAKALVDALETIGR
jgi:hypothetical protein